MMRKFPVIRPSPQVKEVIAGLTRLCSGHRDADFSARLSAYFGAKHIFLVNSGLTAFYLILETLKKQSDKKEVVLPAYTADCLVVPIRRAGLKPVLCDISLEDFNLDGQSFLSAISPRTLAALAVHLFGIPVADIAQIKANMPEQVCLVEDCAQAMGSRINDAPVGSFTEISFFSFNRGKNFTTYGGGCIATNDEHRALQLKRTFEDLARAQKLSSWVVAFRMAAYLIGTDPWVYGLGNIFLRRFKEAHPAADFALAALSPAQTKLGAYLLPKTENWFLRRYQNAGILLGGLEGAKGIILPKIRAQSFPVFNRLPILFEDTALLRHKERQLWNAGFESSRLYLEPLHWMFELGYKKTDFPNAVYLAEHLLTLPVYPGLSQRDLEIIIYILRQAS